MSGPIVRTGTNQKYWDGWDQVFAGAGKGKKAAPAKAAKKAAAKPAKKAAKKATKKK